MTRRMRPCARQRRVDGLAEHEMIAISRIACRVAARTAGAPSRLVSRPMVPCGVSPGWITRADMPSAHAEALTRNALDLVS